MQNAKEREPGAYLKTTRGSWLLTDELSWQGLPFELPAQLEAREPPEARGLARDEVRLLVSYCHSDQLVHTRFRALPTFLRRGDVLVINTSGTMKAALKARHADGELLELHLSTRLPAELWVVEVRQVLPTGSRPYLTMRAGEVLTLPEGGRLELYRPYVQNSRTGEARLWVAALDLPEPLDVYLEHHGFPIRYSYVEREWPLEYYQSVFVTETGSAEMPSASRPFTAELVTRLVAEGIQFAPVLLHTGVASLEAHEPPYEEYYRVPAESAELVNAARRQGRRIIAIGTTPMRAIETVADQYGVVHAGEGWTDLVITPRRGLYVVNGLLTGFHEPQASHLALLEALAGREHLKRAYAAALQEGYLWHEFGDVHLILP
ncbi:S-adenosylmethionine:tRNA ribosyltransferase-isomerase [Thermogemmatispora sp.]|uniref:S-adenosylmethionine:tRNA ribosyltransferase-isomerase n=1 Tax=Thermogemmatispora sp. TaxID=1968838 RepID=UPI001D54C9B4|nr:S-adenosylmethionine:tRNA ribosyltransferase-isomerase [Thermogemmatispora sp.]MBX5450201.1 S-adenosylmethionine:tRNA ribosyltransferase-isomerase [Thermogemmatispora sp.]